MKFHMSNVASLYDRSREIIKYHGIISFSWRVLRAAWFSFWMPLFLYRRWYVYEHDLQNTSSLREEYLKPSIPEFHCRIISSLEEAQQLRIQGYDILKLASHASDKLNRGAIAFCLFNNQELMHIGWLCRNKDAKDSVNPVPYAVDYSSTACIEGAETMPRYIASGISATFRNYKGFLTYSYYIRAQYLLDHGISKARYAILLNNTASQKIVERFGANKLSIIRLLKIMGWKFWKENFITSK
jgi:hypothetical protein